MSKLGERAVVLGASMAGLVAARVLSEFYRTVTLVERDMLPDNAAQRRGVPQGRHVYGLFSGGSSRLRSRAGMVGNDDPFVRSPTALSFTPISVRDCAPRNRPAQG